MGEVKASILDVGRQSGGSFLITLSGSASEVREAEALAGAIDKARGRISGVHSHREKLILPFRFSPDPEARLRSVLLVS